MLASRIRVLLPAWRRTVWEEWRGGAWVVVRPGRRPLVAVSACNPDGRRLGDAANRDRDLALRRVLRRCGLPHRRCRGRLGDWCEAAWLIPDGAQVPRLLAAFGQLAVQRWDAHGAGVWWRWRAYTRLR